jgi:hypothetical protein
VAFITSEFEVVSFVTKNKVLMNDQKVKVNKEFKEGFNSFVDWYGGC